MGQFWIGVAAWPAILQYVLRPDEQGRARSSGRSSERRPEERHGERLERERDKHWDLGWVYTVIAGVLNLLVIYDALAGPMFREPPKWMKEESREDARRPSAPPPPPAQDDAPPANPQGEAS